MRVNENDRENRHVSHTIHWSSVPWYQKETRASRDASRALARVWENPERRGAPLSHPSRASRDVQIALPRRHAPSLNYPIRFHSLKPLVNGSHTTHRRLIRVKSTSHPSYRERVCAVRTVSVFISSMMASVFAEARTTDERAAWVGRATDFCASREFTQG